LNPREIIIIDKNPIDAFFVFYPTLLLIQGQCPFYKSRLYTIEQQLNQRLKTREEISTFS
jgi:hypothetical protein